jgi:anti-sigma regulatory factor (Ser/Thr protein kinase)
MPWQRGVLVALADGLGHGPRAAEAARAFLASVERHAELPLAELFSQAHRELLRTRGVVAAVARIDQECGSVEVGGIGNIAAVVLRGGGGHSAHAMMVPGVLGSAYRSVRPQALPMDTGDSVIMHSDGVRSRFDFGVIRSMTAQAGSEHVVMAAAKPTDDAACVVARALACRPGLACSEAPRTRPAESLEVPIRSSADAACAAAQTRAYGARIGLSPRAQWEMSLVASELATNVLKFAVGGMLTLRVIDSPRAALELEMVDRGRGIRDVAAAVVDGFSEGAMLSPEHPRRAGQGLGVGLGTVHRMSDDVSIDSAPERGTRIIALKFLG